MNMHSKTKKLWKRGLSLFLAALTVFNLSSQGLILTVHALGGKEVEAPEVSVTFSKDQLPGSMANQVNERLYMLPSQAEMSLHITMQPGYTKGYATGAYIRLELPYFYVDDNGEIIITDKKPSGIDDSRLMGIEAKISGLEKENWVVDPTQGEAAPVEQLMMPEVPVAVEPEQQAETPAETKPEQQAETPVETKPEQQAETPAETKPEQQAETPAETKPEQQAETPVETKPEQQPETPVETKPEQQPETPAETKPEQQPETPVETEPEQQPEAPVITESEQPVAASDEDGYRRGVLHIMAQDETVRLKNEPISFIVTLRFFGDVPENVGGSVRLGGGYEHYHSSTGEVSSDGFQIVPGSAGEGIHSIDIVNSNLRWDYSIEQVGMSVMWDKYNYVTYHVKVANVSDETTTSKIDKFTLFLEVQDAQTDPGKSGVLEEDMMQWEYNPNGDPIWNEDTSNNSRDKTFVGVPNEGGVLVHDVTNFTPEERAQLDLEHFTNLGETLPYHYSMSGVIGVEIPEQQGELYPPHMSDEANRRSYREYYISVPYTNNLRGKLTTDTKFRPTIYFGGRNFPWTKETNFVAGFIKRNPQFAHEKYVLTGDGSKWEEKYVAIGATDTYYLGGFHNTGNVPAFLPVITDDLPDGFEEKRIEIVLEADEEGKPQELSSWFQQEPIEFVFKDSEGEIQYITVTELGIQPSRTVDPNTQTATYSYWIENAIEVYLENHPNRADWTFTRQLRFHLKEKVAVDEVFPGHVAIVGRTPLEKSFINTINTDYVTKYWQPKTESMEAHYEEEYKKVAADTAILTSQPSSPILEPHGVLRRPDGSEEEAPYGQHAQIPLGDDAATLRYVLGNGNPYTMYTAKLDIGPLIQNKDTSDLSQTEIEFKANEVVLSAALLDLSQLNRVELTDLYGRQIVFSAGELQRTESGDIRITRDDWINKYRKFDELDRVRIYFNEFPGSVAFTERSFVDVKGAVNRVGEYLVNATWGTNYQTPGVAERNVTDTAKITVAIANPIVETHGVLRGETDIVGPANGYQEVPLGKPGAAVRYVLGNDSMSAMNPAELEIGPLFLKNGNSDASCGFYTDELYFSPAMFGECADISHVILTDKNGKQVTIPADEIQNNIISESQWKEKDPSFDALNQINVHFSRFDKKVDFAKEAYVEVRGASNVPGNYWIKAVWKTEYKYNNIGSISATGYAYLRSPYAKPILETHGVLRGDPDVVGPANDYQDVPLAENGSAMRYILGNNSPTAMKHAELEIGPLFLKEGDANTAYGFYTDELYFAPAILGDCAEIIDVVLTDRNGKQVTIAADEIKNNVISEAQ